MDLAPDRQRSQEKDRRDQYKEGRTELGMATLKMKAAVWQRVSKPADAIRKETAAACVALRERFTAGRGEIPVRSEAAVLEQTGEEKQRRFRHKNQ